MIRVQTPDGPKNFLLRGIQSTRGKCAVSKVSVLTPDGDKVVWDLSLSGGGFQLTAFPQRVQGAGASNYPIAVTTILTEITPEGESGSINYQWEKLSGDDLWEIERVNASFTRFTASSVNAETVQTATFRCTATDAVGREATVDVDATAQNYGDPRGLSF